MRVRAPALLFCLRRGDPFAPPGSSPVPPSRRDRRRPVPPSLPLRASSICGVLLTLGAGGGGALRGRAPHPFGGSGGPPRPAAAGAARRRKTAAARLEAPSDYFASNIGPLRCLPLRTFTPHIDWGTAWLFCCGVFLHAYPPACSLLLLPALTPAPVPAEPLPPLLPPPFRSSGGRSARTCT